MENDQKGLILRILVLVGVIALMAAIFVFREQLQKLEEYGYVGIFLLSIVSNATIIIPVPGVAITTAMGAFFNPIGVAVAAGLGASIGELSGYLAGFSGQGLVQKAPLYNRLMDQMNKKSIITYGLVFLLAFIPNPVMDLAGVASGALKLPIWKFLAACALGKVLKMFLFAYAGYFSFLWITEL